MATKTIAGTTFKVVSKGQGRQVYHYEEDWTSLAVWKTKSGRYLFEIAVLGGEQRGIAFSSHRNLGYSFATLDGCVKRAMKEFRNVQTDYCS